MKQQYLFIARKTFKNVGILKFPVLSICLGLLFHVISSCQNQKKTGSVEVVDIGSNMNKMEVLNLSQFTDDIQYVPLETKEDLPLSWISNIEFKDSLILVTDMKLCLLYDSHGRYLSKIGVRGRGPGEYEFVSEFYITNSNTIIMQSLYDLFEYNSNGSFIKKHKNAFMLNNNENEYVSSWLVLNDSLFLGHEPNTTGLIANKALIFKNNGDIKYYFKNYTLFKRERTVASGFEDHAQIYRFKNSIFYKEFYNDTLFYLNDHNQLIPRYYLNLGKYGEPVSERAKLLQGPSMSKYLYTWNVFQTEKYLLMKCQFGDHFPAKRRTPKTIMGKITTMYNTVYALGIFNKKTKVLSFCKPTSTDNPLFTSGLYNDIDAGPRFFPAKQINDSTMVMWVKADELKNHVASDDFKNSVPKYAEKKKELEKLANSLKETDNPVLMIVKLKK